MITDPTTVMDPVAAAMAATTSQNLLILQRFEDLLNAKLELCMQLQSLVDTSAQSLDAFRTHCSTSRELIKDEIRMLEGKLIQRIGRQLAVRRILTKHFTQLSQDLQLSQYLETDLDLFLAQREAKKASSQESLTAAVTVTETSTESALTCTLDKIKLLLDEELSQLPSLKQWLEIVGLQPTCVKAIMELVGNVEDLLQTSESKLKAVIVSASGVCTCRPMDLTPVNPDLDVSLHMTSEVSSQEDTLHHHKDSTGLRVDTGFGVKEKGKLPFHIREDVRRLITACRLLRIYTDRLIAEDTDLRELSLLNPTHLPVLTNFTSTGQTGPIASSSSSSATPPNSLVRKESVKSLYWDSWRYRPSATPVTPTPGDQHIPSETSTSSFCAIHLGMDRRYGNAMVPEQQRLPSMLSSFSSDDNFLSSPSTTSQSLYQPPHTVPILPSTNDIMMVTSNRHSSQRLTSQSSVMSSVSTATTTGDEADLASTFADMASASSSCANSVFPSANNILQLVQQYDTSPATMKRQYAAVGGGLDERDSHSQQSVFQSPGSGDSNIVIRPSSSTPSLLLTGSNPPRLMPMMHQQQQHGGPVLSGRKEVLKFTKSSSLESSLRSRLNSDEISLHVAPLVNNNMYHSGSSDSSSTTNLTSAAKMVRQHSPAERMQNPRRMCHSIPHVFKNSFALTQASCAYCEKPLRGLGRKCRHCKLRCHPDCAEKVPPSCGLPEELVREYLRSMRPRATPTASSSNHHLVSPEDVRVEEDDDTLSEITKRKQSEIDLTPNHKKYATVSKGSDVHRESYSAASGGKTWRSRLFNQKSPPPVDSPVARKAPPKLKKQRSLSTGNAREVTVVPQENDGDKPASRNPSPEVKSPLTRRISGSFSLPRDRRKRNNLVLPQSDDVPGSKSHQNLSSYQVKDHIDTPQREARLFSDPSPLDQDKQEQENRRTVSVSSGVEGTSPGHISQDSSAPGSSSLGSSGPNTSVPPSPASFSYGRSPSTSTGPPISPLAVTSFVNPRTYRSFMRTVKDQIKSHFHWPQNQPHPQQHLAKDHHMGGASGSGMARSPSETLEHHVDTVKEVKKTPLFHRRKSTENNPASQWYDNPRGGKSNQPLTPEEEEESVRLEAEDSFPAEPSNTFPTVLVQANALLDQVKAAAKEESKKNSKQPRRFSLLEPPEEVEPTAPAVLRVPTVEVDDDNEPSYSSEVSGDHDHALMSGSPTMWRRQQSIYLRELNIPYEQLNITDKVGQGTFGEVHRGKWHGDVAIKFLNDDYLYNDADEAHEVFKQDLATLRKTRHDNLVLFMGACMKRSHEGHQQIIITSLLSRALPTNSSAGTSITLHDLIHEQRGKSLAAPYKVQLNRLLIIASQVSQGMGYLHRRGIVHKDLKSKNIFVTHEKCIITDYGLFSISKMSQQGRSDDLLWFPRHWLCYLAPEICRHLQTPRQQKHAFMEYRKAPHNSETKPFGAPFSIFTDVYAFGTVLYELCTGTFPLLYSANNAQRLVHSISTSSVHSGLATPSGETPTTPAAMLPPPTPNSLTSMASSSGSTRSPRPPDPNLPGSLESALYLLSSGNHPIYRLFRSRINNNNNTTSNPSSTTNSRAGSSSTPPGARHIKQHPGSPPQTLTIAPSTPPTPVHVPMFLLSPSIDETAARELIELISVCWSPKIRQRREFQDIAAMLERVPKKSLARSPSHPVHGNNPTFPKDMIHY